MQKKKVRNRFHGWHNSQTVAGKLESIPSQDTMGRVLHGTEKAPIEKHQQVGSKRPTKWAKSSQEQCFSDAPDQDHRRIKDCSAHPKQNNKPSRDCGNGQWSLTPTTECSRTVIADLMMHREKSFLTCLGLYSQKIQKGRGEIRR